MWYVDFAWKMPLKGEKIFRGCAPDPLTPGQVRGVPEGGCRGYVWCAMFPDGIPSGAVAAKTPATSTARDADYSLNVGKP